MELDPEVVKKEVDRYNELAKAGEDTDFGKDPKFLKEFKAEGPYYLDFDVRCNPWCFRRNQNLSKG